MCIMVLGNTNAVHYERLSISDAARALHFMGSGGADVYGIADIVLSIPRTLAHTECNGSTKYPHKYIPYGF